MNASYGAGAAMAAPASENLRARSAWLATLPTRVKDGSFPIRSHRTVAELWSAAR